MSNLSEGMVSMMMMSVFCMFLFCSVRMMRWRVSWVWSGDVWLSLSYLALFVVVSTMMMESVVASAYVCKCALKSECFMEVNVKWLLRFAYFFMEVVDCGGEFLGSGVRMI